MPAPQFHLTFGESVAHHPGIVAEVRSAVANEPVYTHLGSIFHDLPYYGNMVAEAIRYGFRRPAIDAPWAYRMHCIRPDRFIASFVRSARTTPGLTRDERLALIGGILSHCALDLTLHPLVNYCARRDTALFAGHESFHHRVTEKYHALFFHLERFGADVIGQPDFYQKTRVVKRTSVTRADAEPAIIAFMQNAYRGSYGDAPAPRLWTGWVRSFRHFGLMVGNKLAARDSTRKRKDERLMERYYRSADFDFNAFYVHSERRLAELVNLAYRYFEAGDFSPAAEERFCVAAHIDNLADPDGLGLPLLPSLPTPVARPKPKIIRALTARRQARQRAA
ncbi:MAG: hypothetical protein EXR72_23860 [Myxococcales bacterium]|nr:hypothetical protein [Myxococcales bacterium]